MHPNVLLSFHSLFDTSILSTFKNLFLKLIVWQSGGLTMEALPFQTHVQLSPTLRSLRRDNGEPKDTMTKNLHSRIQANKVQKVRKRLFLQWMGLSPMLCVFPIFAAPLPEMKEPDVIRTLKLPSGVRIQEIVEGEGPEACDGDLVQVNYVCRRSNGYFVYSTVDQFSGESMPVILPLDEKEIIQGLKAVLIGMKVGGKRRALIPPYLGYTNENLKPIPDEFGPRRSLLSHAQEPLVFEVQLLKVL